MLIAHAIPLLLLLSRLLTGQRLLADPDSLSHLYATHTLLATPAAWLSGLALWNTYNFHGFPTFLGETASVAPLTLFFKTFLHPLLAYHWSIFFHFLLGGFFFSLLLLRRLSTSPLAAFLGGFTYIVSLWWILPFFSMVPVLPVFPLLLWCAIDLSAHRRRSFLISTLLLTYAWYSVHYILLPFLWVAGFSVAAFCTWKSQKRTGLLMLSILLLFSASIIISTFFALPKLLPALLYAELSTRGGGLTWEAASIESIGFLTPLHYLFPYLELPFLYFGEAPVFVGVFSLACAATALITLRSSRQPEHLRYTILALATAYFLSLLIALKYSPLFLLIHKLPVFSYLRGAGRWLILGNLALSALVAVGFDVLLKEEAASSRLIIAKIALWTVGIVLALGLVVHSMLTFFGETVFSSLKDIFDTHLYTRTSGLPPEHYHNIIRDYLQQIADQFNPLFPRSGLPLLSLVLLGLLVSKRLWLKLGASRAILLIATSVGSSIPILSLYHRTIPRDGFPPDIVTSAYLNDHPGEVFSVFPNFAKFLTLDRLDGNIETSNRFSMELLVPNRNLWYRVKSIDYFDNIMARRMGKLLAYIGSEQVPLSGLAKLPLPLKEKIDLLLSRKQILDVLNTKTLLSIWPLRHPELQLVRKEVITEYKIPLRVYENRTARPFAYFADAVTSIEENEDHAFSMLTEGEWKGRKTLIECRKPCPSLTPTGRGRTEILEERPTKIVLKTQTREWEWLVVSVNNLPGWSVTMDGKEVQPSIAMTTFFGVPVPKGEHIVTMEFTYGRLLRDSIQWVSKAFLPIRRASETA
jgi:hypothetical protein